MLSDKIIEKAKAHAVACYPNESCGLVTEKGYEPQINVSPTPTKNFKISNQALKKTQNRTLAVIHSHPDGPHYPSEQDMRGQQATQKPWYIVCVDEGVVTDFFGWGDNKNIEPLLGRHFRHGVTDCYSIIKDFHYLHKNIILNEYPRAWEWWRRGEDLYEKYFKEAGFYRIRESEVKRGDVFLATVASKVINHGGVYVGDGLILHQLGGRIGYAPDRLSCRAPVVSWSKYINTWIRHD